MLSRVDEFIKQLTENKQNPETISRSIYFIATFVFTQEQRQKILIFAAQNNFTALFDAFMRKDGHKILNEKLQNDSTYLHVAAASDSVGVVKFLTGNSVSQQIDADKQYPLQLALKHGHKECALLLCTHYSFNVEAFQLVWTRSKSALSLIVDSYLSTNDQIMIGVLERNLTGFSINQYRNNRGASAVIIAAATNLETLKWLVKDKRCSLNDRFNDNDVLVVAVKKDQIETVEWLIKEKKCLRDCLNEHSETLLPLVVSKNSLRILRYLKFSTAKLIEIFPALIRQLNKSDLDSLLIILGNHYRTYNTTEAEKEIILEFYQQLLTSPTIEYTDVIQIFESIEKIAPIAMINLKIKYYYAHSPEKAAQFCIETIEKEDNSILNWKQTASLHLAKMLLLREIPPLSETNSPLNHLNIYILSGKNNELKAALQALYLIQDDKTNEGKAYQAAAHYIICKENDHKKKLTLDNWPTAVLDYYKNYCIYKSGEKNILNRALFAKTDKDVAREIWKLPACSSNPSTLHYINKPKPQGFDADAKPGHRRTKSC